MQFACEYHLHMSKMIQIRNVPETVHRKLKSHAALEGMSLSEYLLVEVRRAAERPSLSELRQRLAQRTPVKLEVSPARAIREERDSR
jgi:plasmid stability protein